MKQSREEFNRALEELRKRVRAADLERVPLATPEAVAHGDDFTCGMPIVDADGTLLTRHCAVCGGGRYDTSRNLLKLTQQTAQEHWLAHTLAERHEAIKQMRRGFIKLEYEREKHCERCGATNTVADATWRWAGDHWQHRCKGVHPQVGHWPMDPSAEVDRLRVLLQTYKEMAEQ